MPVRKYRSVAEMPQAGLCTPLDSENLRLACALSATAARLSPLPIPPGVHRYRSIASASAARDAWERQAGGPRRGR